MSKPSFGKIIKRSIDIRKRYHQLEKSIHGSEWSVEEDALAFLTDAGLVGRNIMSQQERWPKEDAEQELRHKIGECMWWLLILADRVEMNPEEILEEFLTRTEKKVSIKPQT